MRNREHASQLNSANKHIFLFMPSFSKFFVHAHKTALNAVYIDMGQPKKYRNVVYILFHVNNERD